MPAAIGETFGEAVFSTGMTGYQETLTDPSYRRQVVVATAPQIGNTGWVAGAGPRVGNGPDNASDNESDRIWVAGYVIRDLAPRPVQLPGDIPSLPAEDAHRQGVVGMAGVDTRALTRHLGDPPARCAGGMFPATRCPGPARWAGGPTPTS